MSDIIKRAETAIRLSDPRKTPPHIMGIMAELVKALQESIDLSRQIQLDRDALSEEISKVRELQRADRNYALELHGELQARRSDAR